MKFAKLFDLEDGEQVLLTVEYDDEKDQYELVFKTDFDGATASMKLGYKEESMALESMEKVELERAQELRSSMSKHFITF